MGCLNAIGALLADVPGCPIPEVCDPSAAFRFSLSKNIRTHSVGRCGRSITHDAFAALIANDRRYDLDAHCLLPEALPVACADAASLNQPRCDARSYRINEFTLGKI